MQQSTKPTTQAIAVQVQLSPSAHVIPIASFCVLHVPGCMAWSQLKPVAVFKVPVAGCSVLMLCVELSVS